MVLEFTGHAVVDEPDAMPSTYNVVVVPFLTKAICCQVLRDKEPFVVAKTLPAPNWFRLKSVELLGKIPYTAPVAGTNVIYRALLEFVPVAKYHPSIVQLPVERLNVALDGVEIHWLVPLNDPEYVEVVFN